MIYYIYLREKCEGPLSDDRVMRAEEFNKAWESHSVSIKRKPVGMLGRERSGQGS
jgi:hypothetical protein